MSAHWIACPQCGAQMAVKRLGSVGVPKVPDSDVFKCGYCGKTFRVKSGETLLESFRSKGL